MKKGLLALTALVAFVFALPLMADAKIEITGAALVSAQDVDFDSTSGNADEDFNFNDPRVNLYVNGEVSDKISVTAKFWAANDWSQVRVWHVPHATWRDNRLRPRNTDPREGSGHCLTTRASRLALGVIGAPCPPTGQGPWGASGGRQAAPRL